MTSPPTTRATILAGCTAALALLASIVAAVGPAHGEQAEYEWPPTTIPSDPAPNGWYSPLPLLNRVPGAIEVMLPCSLAPSLGESQPVAVLATARRPEPSHALQVLLDEPVLSIRVGEREVASLPWPTSCPLTFEMEDGELRLPQRTIRLQTETLEDMPVVTGLFTSLDLRIGDPPRVALRTRTYVTSWTNRQVVAGFLAFVLAVLTLLLLVGRTRPARPFESLRRRFRSVWRALHPTDVVVAIVLLVWWIVAPTLFDDGWLWAEHRAFADIGEANLYFDSFGLTLPLGYWVMWIEHWIVGSTSDLVVLRLPSLAVLGASWLLCRWCLRRALPAPPTSAVRWTLCAGFLVGAVAWGMTLRFEPLVSLLTLLNLGAMISFAAAPRLAPLAMALAATALALTVHPVGIVAVAPLVAGMPNVIRWIRGAGREVVAAFGALLIAGAAFALALFVLDADLTTRLSDAQVLRQSGLTHDEPWWREYIRYVRFDEYGGGTAVRRLSLALLVLSIVALLTRLRSVRTTVSGLPARSVAVGFVLLAFIPSKWPWHFGALAAIGAVAVAAEVERLVCERSSLGRRSTRSIPALALITAAALWAWAADGRWGPLDLQRMRWAPVFNVVVFVLCVAFVMTVASVTRVRRVRRAQAVPSATSHVAWAVPLVSAAVISVTGGMLIVDASVTSWTPARQNLEALAGRSSCGVASQLRGDVEFADLLGHRGTPTLLAAPAALYFPCASMPTIDGGLIEIPRLVVLQRIATGGPWPLNVKDSPFASVVDLHRVLAVGEGPGGIELFSVEADANGFVLLPAVRR